MAKTKWKKKEDIKENWWISLANNKSGLKVFTKIPFFDFGKENRFVEKFELVAVANKKPEKSSEDFTLLVIETAKEIKKSQIVVAFSEKNIAMRLLKFVSIKQFEEVNFSLVEIEGFYEENDLILKELSIHKIKPFVKVLGHYPKQILLNNSF